MALAEDEIAELAAQGRCIGPALQSAWNKPGRERTMIIFCQCGDGRDSMTIGTLEALAADQWLSRRPVWQRSRCMQQGHHADTSLGGCRAVAGESEAAQFWFFWREML